MKKWIKISLWTLFIIGLLVLAFFIKETLDKKPLPKPNITIPSDGDNTFITNDELQKKLERKGFYFDTQKRSELEIEEIENYISSISQVKTVDVFQKMNGEWNINVELRKPIARIYNTAKENFYLDEDGYTFLTTPTHTSRTLIFTGEIDDRQNSISAPEIINNDSLISIRKLDDIYRISRYVCNDPLFHSLIGQIHLQKNGDFILVPLVGDQQIIFGTAHSEEEVQGKFKKLRIFYNEAMPFEGWDTYSEINLKFEDQIVCKKKDENE
ncbi:MAG TPA: hypothetical protein EYG86_07055 [Crocinitomicaceae bacterium]|nr:hypothetical protein [Crocinitomicaceae bacterium]